MEDAFETIIGLIFVIAMISISAGKNKKKKRPGQSRKSEQPQPVPEPTPTREEKLARLREKKAAKKAAAMEPERMVPERMEPETMEPRPMTVGGYTEGDSYRDEDGCVGGSLAHDESSHQGVEFHAPGTHGLAVAKTAVKPEAQAPKPRVDGSQLRSAVIWAEILDRPVSMRDQ